MKLYVSTLWEKNKDQNKEESNTHQQCRNSRKTIQWFCRQCLLAKKNQKSVLIETEIRQRTFFFFGCAVRLRFLGVGVESCSLDELTVSIPLAIVVANQNEVLRIDDVVPGGPMTAS